MANVQIKIEGLEPLVKRLDAFKPQVDQAIEKGLEESGALLLGILQRYPSPPGGSSYRRTGTLGRAWTSAPIVGPGRKIGNATSYAQWVQGPNQARMHAGRWTNILQAFEQSRGKIESILQRYLEQLAEKLAGH